MANALDELEADDGCAVVVVTGAGDKAFSAGMDLKAFAVGRGRGHHGRLGGIRRHHPAALPQADHRRGERRLLWPAGARSCSRATSWSPPTTPPSASPKPSGAWWPARAGSSASPSGCPSPSPSSSRSPASSIDAARALQLGLINRVVPAALLMDETLALAGVIADNAPLAVRWSKYVMVRAAGVSEEEGWKLNAEAVGAVFSSADAMEGPVAFAEKRKPNWQGK